GPRSLARAVRLAAAHAPAVAVPAAVAITIAIAIAIARAAITSASIARAAIASTSITRAGVAGADRRQLLDALARDLRIVGEPQADAAALAVDLDDAHGEPRALVQHLRARACPQTS